ncbi:MAG: TrkA family potassium uptake protein [Candidatus Babeliales bacterium]
MKFCVIGLGRFGYQVATTLAENGMEVLGIDADETIIASIRDQITQAICMRATDEVSLRSVGVDEMDVVIVAMGENFAQSILVTALLKKRLIIKRVIARAINDIHKEILTLIGADQIVLPEQEIGRDLAEALSLPFMEHTRLSENFSISQLPAAKQFIGKTILELPLYDKYHVKCIGVKRGDQIDIVSLDYVIKEGDKLLFAGHDDALEAIAKL